MAVCVAGVGDWVRPDQAMLCKTRMPRLMDSTRTITPYNAREADGYSRVLRLQAIGLAKKEAYRYHTPVLGMIEVSK